MASRVDWTQAFVFYASLGPDRTHKRVAERFGVTRRTVETHASRDRWTERLADIEAEAQERATALIIRERTARVADTLRIIDAARVRFAGQLRTAEFRMTASDFVGLMKLEALLEGDATDRVQIADVQPVLAAFARIAVLEAAPERRAEVMRLLEAASAGLVALPAGEAA